MASKSRRQINCCSMALEASSRKNSSMNRKTQADVKTQMLRINSPKWDSTLALRRRSRMRLRNSLKQKISQRQFNADRFLRPTESEKICWAPTRLTKRWWAMSWWRKNWSARRSSKSWTTFTHLLSLRNCRMLKRTSNWAKWKMGWMNLCYIIKRRICRKRRTSTTFATRSSGPRMTG